MTISLLVPATPGNPVYPDQIGVDGLSSWWMLRSSKDENLPSASFAAVQVPQKAVKVERHFCSPCPTRLIWKVSDVRMESEDVCVPELVALHIQ